MKISPISFGRAIKVNSTEKIADTIATAANHSNYGIDASIKSRTPLQKFAETIFYDTHLPNGKAKVITFGPDQVYIFSGKEADTASKLIRQTSAQIDKNNSFVNSLPDRICRAEQREKYGKINQELLADRNRKITSLVENGEDGERKSQIDVELEPIDDAPEFNSLRRIQKITYTSSSENTKEHIVYEKKKIKSS